MLMIGAGGIQSYLAEHLQRLIMAEQIDMEEYEIYIADFDVVERKNIRYQNFEVSEIFENKATALSKRYGFFPIVKKIEDESQLDGYDLYIMGVDNSATRKFIYEYCISHNKEFIDLRCEGRGVAFFTTGVDNQEYIKSLGTISDEGGSCQLKYDLDKDVIQNGNVIIASIGSQLVLNWIRSEYNPTKFIQRI